jgi:hypothetical protein
VTGQVGGTPTRPPAGLTSVVVYPPDSWQGASLCCSCVLSGTHVHALILPVYSWSCEAVCLQVVCALLGQLHLTPAPHVQLQMLDSLHVAAAQLTASTCCS